MSEIGFFQLSIELLKILVLNSIELLNQVPSILSVFLICSTKKSRFWVQLKIDFLGIPSWVTQLNFLISEFLVELLTQLAFFLS